MSQPQPEIIAALGPTNTGKTHRAVERMLEHKSGMMGLPLRLLAREVYDRVTQTLGENQVALVTGEEKRIPKQPRYWICTVEAMPRANPVDFLAVDEIQLAGHPERGHVFTEHLLHSRGRLETWFMGSPSMKHLMQELVPEARLQRFPRLSKLSGAGSHSLGALPRRSAIVAFSQPRLYELAERLRARRGGAAVVLGALSPRARNAQVAMYQAGEVDYLVATDAIGMGLNLEVEHIAFADRRKFDGREERPLDLPELAQIAGRAGRYQTDGSFGTLAPEPPLPSDLERRIEQHQIGEQRSLFWRNHQLRFDSIEVLLKSLKQRPDARPLRPLTRAEDFQALKVLARREEITNRASSSEHVQLLWDICQIPDYRGLMMDQHENLLGQIFCEIMDRGRLGDEWLEPRITRLERTDGDIETLMQRIAFIRTWTYVANHPQWLQAPAAWQARTAEIEDKLSDALHEALVARFIDLRRTSAGPALPKRVSDQNHPFSGLESLRAQLGAASPQTTQQGLSHALAEAAHEDFRVSRVGKVSFMGAEVAQLVRGRVLVEPQIQLADLELAPGALGQVQRRLRAFSRDFVLETLGPIAQDPEGASANVRGLLYQLSQTLGSLQRQANESLLAALSTDDRDRLTDSGVVLGQRWVFAPRLWSSECLESRAALVRAFYGARAPHLLPGSIALAAVPTTPKACYLALGYDVISGFAVRIDMLESLLEKAQSASLTLNTIARSLRLDQAEAKPIAHSLGLRPRQRRRKKRGRKPQAS